MSKARKRYYRTIVLGIAALATLLWAAVDQFGISVEELLNLFIVTLVVIGGVIAVAALAALCWVLVRRLFSRD